MKTKILYKAVSLITVIIMLFTFLGCESPSAEGISNPSESKALTVSEATSPVAMPLDTSPNRILRRASTSAADEVRGIWISFLEMKSMLENKTEAQFSANIEEAFSNIANFGLNTVFVQVRPYGDALYDSDYFPWSHTITGREGKNPGFDPLEIMVKEAKRQNLLIEAWINPYRIRPSNIKDKPLSKDNPASKWLAVNDRAVVKHGNLISYNPASLKAQELIVNGVREIVRKYDVDGIHIDDYFYPSTGTTFDTTFDQPEYENYKARGGVKSFDDWRRSNVELLVSKMYNAVKAENPKVLFGISPASNIKSNYEVQYFDAAKIASTPGFCDYIAPQIYFGYENTVQPYSETLKAWETIVTEPTIDLYVGVASYKVGTHDGKAGGTEWKENSNICARQIAEARNKSQYKGFVLYRYDHIFKPVKEVQKQVEKESNNIKELMK